MIDEHSLGLAHDLNQLIPGVLHMTHTVSSGKPDPC